MIPDGFEPLFRSSPFIDLIGPVYCRTDTSGWRLGLQAASKHCNNRGLVHGGVLSSLADIALGYNAAFGGEGAVPLVTVNLSIDYAGAIREGEWFEISVDVQKVGKQVAFANAFFWLGDERIARASAVFKVLEKR